MQAATRAPWRYLAAVALVVVIVWTGGRRLARRHAPKGSLHAAAIAPADATKTLPSAIKPAAKPAAAQRSAKSRKTAPAAAEAMRLTVRVHALTWMQVTADGSVVFQQVLQPGARETWLAKREILLWLGDAGGVSLELNGRPLGTPGKRGEVLRGLRVTPEGIQR